MEELNDILYFAQMTTLFYYPHYMSSGRDGDRPLHNNAVSMLPPVDPK